MGEFNKAKRALEFAQKKRRIVQDDYFATLRDLELQIKSSDADFGVAKKIAEKTAEAKKAGAISTKAVMEAEQQLDHARANLERLKTRYDLYKKAGEGLAEEEKLDVSDGSSNTYEIAAWGLSLATYPIVRGQELANTKFQAGMRVIRVPSKGLAAKSGIQHNDILVGIDGNETKGAVEIQEIMRRLAKLRASDDPTAKKEIKFYVVRNQEVKYGTLPVLPDSPAKPDAEEIEREEAIKQRGPGGI
jgi:hypothetical protein